MLRGLYARELLAKALIPLDVFICPYHNERSGQITGVIPSTHWPGRLAHSDAYWAVAPAEENLLYIP